MPFPYYGYAYGWHPSYNYYAIPFATVEGASQGPSVDVKRFGVVNKELASPGVV